MRRVALLLATSATRTITPFWQVWHSNHVFVAGNALQYHYLCHSNASASLHHMLAPVPVYTCTLYVQCIKIQSMISIVVYNCVCVCVCAGFFLTKIFHPNVASNGAICVNTLKRDWKPDHGIRHILLVIQQNSI